MTGVAGRLLGGMRRARADGLWLYLIPAHAMLQAQQEAQTLAAGDDTRLGLCENACILARAARKDGRAVFTSGEDVLNRVPAQTIERWAGEYLALCQRENPSCCTAEHTQLLQQMKDEPYERLKWKVLRAFGVLPSERRAKQLTDGEYLYCVLQLMLDEQETFDALCPSCRQTAAEPRCRACGKPLPEQNASFDEARYEELKKQ